MITRLKLKPGQKGTKSLVEKYGDDLVCVRYRYDNASRTRIKTVELILERKQLPLRRRTSRMKNLCLCRLLMAKRNWEEWPKLRVAVGILM
jgi:hypothetical protein